MQSSTAADGRDREQRLLAAKKKLKNFRAKQAQAEQTVKRRSVTLSPKQTRRISASVEKAVGQAIAKASEEAQSNLPVISSIAVGTSKLSESNADTTHATTSHSRSASRTGHGRGHSRAGSISIGADAMAQTAASALRESLQSTQYSPATRSRRSSVANTRPLASNSSNAANTSHVRGHSRSGSRALSRPSSFFGSAATNMLAREHSAEEVTSSMSPKDNSTSEWADVDDKIPNPVITQHVKEPVPTADVLLTSPSANSPSSQRHSRHMRKASLATKRESMEMMGGLGPSAFGPMTPEVSPSAKRASRRMTANRSSGLQSASILFGGPDRRASGTTKDFDWRGFAYSPSQEDNRSPSVDRRTALEKLEGRSRDNSPVGELPRTPVPPSKRSSVVGQRHSRQSSVQLPSFDDIHGAQGMDKRSSVNLLEANEQSTLEKRNSVSASVDFLSMPPTISIDLDDIHRDVTNGKSPSGRPVSVFAPAEAVQPEGLGTLVEEEEEEDDSVSPTVDKPAYSLISEGERAVENEEAQQRRRDLERETIKRTRRSSLQPKPMKLKSRPASLFVGPSQRQGMGLVSSSSLGELRGFAHECANNGLEAVSSTDSAYSTPDLPLSRSDGSLARDWSNLSPVRRKKVPDLVERLTNSPSRDRDSYSSHADSVGHSSQGSPTSNRPAMRALRLGGGSASILDSSQDDHATSDHRSNGSSASKRSSMIGSSSSLSELANTSLLPSNSPTSVRRRSMIYKPLTSESLSTGALVSSATSPSLMTSFEELKIKSQKDVETIELLTSQVGNLTAALVAESDKAKAEYSQLEKWSAEQHHIFNIRILELEDAASTAAQALAGKEAALHEVQTGRAAADAAVQERIEDLEGERDMLQEDVDGWRTRCSDLEKATKSDRAALEESKGYATTLQARILTMAERLQEAGLEVPSPSTMKSSRELSLPKDLATALISPSLSAKTLSNNGYFSPHVQAADPPPQTVQLLKDMRQQIFNLAGSLEHQRKEQLKAQEECDRLRADNERLRVALEQESVAQSPVGSSAGDDKRVFAYDSTLESVDDSNATTTFSYGTTAGTTLSSAGDDESVAVAAAKADRILPMPTSSKGDADKRYEGGVPEKFQNGQNGHAAEFSLSDLDLAAAESITPSESGGMDELAAVRPSECEDPLVPTDEANTEYDMPPLPVAESAGPMAAATQHAALSLSSLSTPASARSSGSSVETHGPQSPTDLEAPGAVAEVMNEIETEDDDEPEDLLHTPVVDRPEFVREWSFTAATHAVRRRETSRTKGRRPGALRRRRVPSVEDFFGLLLCEQLEPLPPLPTSYTSLDMPPVYIEHYHEHEARSLSTSGRPLSFNRPPGSVIARQAAIPGAKGRPPVARSAFVRDSVSSLESANSSSGNSATTTSSSAGRGSFAYSLPGSVVASNALTRMSLQGLTSAFSGLGGFLAGQSGAAVHAAAAATTMCSSAEFDNVSRDHSINWQPSATVQAAPSLKSHGGYEFEPRPSNLPPSSCLKSMGNGMVGAKRFSSTPTQPLPGRMPMQSNADTVRRASQPSHQVAHQGVVSSSLERRTSQQQQGQSGGSGARRRFIDKAFVDPPSPSPVWTLDFTHCTAVGGTGDIFVI